jgi:hypothetical protein
VPRDEANTQATPSNTGGGRLVLDGSGALLLQRDFPEEISDDDFTEQVDALAGASLLRSTDIVARATEQANRP